MAFRTSLFAVATSVMLLAACGPTGEDNNASTNNAPTNNATTNNAATNNTSTNNLDPCAGETLCNTPGTTCVGDILVTCAENALGCLVETRLDCKMSDSVCDGDIASPACVPVCVDEEACIGAEPGDEVCYQRDRVTCVAGADGCLDEERTTCPTDQTCMPGSPPTCVALGTTAQTVLIEDDSMGEDACGDQLSDPGSDLMYVELTDQTGVNLGWGEWVSDDIVFDGNEYVDSGVLDGTQPGLEADMCVSDFNTDSIVSLGCGGWIAVQFVDSGGSPVEVSDTDQIIVGEYGVQCTSGSSADEYLVLGCETDLPGGPADCPWNLGGGSGQTTLEFTP